MSVIELSSTASAALSFRLCARRAPCGRAPRLEVGRSRLKITSRGPNCPPQHFSANLRDSVESSRVVLSRRGRGSGWAVVVVLPGALRKRCNQRRPLQAPEKEVQSGLYTTRYERKLHTEATMGVPFETLIPFAIMLTMFGITGAGLSKVRAMQNVMDRDRRLTGFLRGQTGSAIAPPGFELNNPWRLEKKFR
ncbi:hypothetical protein V499_02092 [Pseudogymnoascus sp. VKM F-103]|nr:hypothetical protein V499_02092 [Pseudogymnoascus sp. VKM F-103]